MMKKAEAAYCLDEGFAQGFPAMIDERAQLLILGSLPGCRSLLEQKYYALPRNAFWPIMGALFAAGPDKPYQVRLQALRLQGVALWDVLAASQRRGSLDADIKESTAVCNDFNALLSTYITVREIFFNGQKAEKMFMRRVLPLLAEDVVARLHFHVLPSTSPAYAAMGFDEKLSRWSVVKKLCTVR